MKIRYFFSISIDDCEEFENKFDIMPKVNGYTFKTYYIDEDDPNVEAVLGYVRKLKKIIDIETFYDKYDLESAEWYSMRCMYLSGYNLNSVYSDSKKKTFDPIFCEKCGYERKQIDLFASKKIKEINNRYFVSLFLDYDIIFTFTKGKDKLLELNIPELKFLNVYTGNKGYLDNVYQMDYPIDDNYSLIIDEAIGDVYKCEACGHIKYRGNGRQLSYNKKTFNLNNYSIFKTKETFGAGIMQDRRTIINKRIYNFLKDNKMLNGIEIIPLKFKDE